MIRVETEDRMFFLTCAVEIDNVSCCDIRMSSLETCELPMVLLLSEPLLLK